MRLLGRDLGTAIAVQLLFIHAPVPAELGRVASDPLQNMKARAEQCRRLAGVTHDEKMRWQLLDWANQIDADLERLKAELGRNQTLG